ncbi:hypothetical protein LY78DRAFT_494264 [Colletotrichum sublineola]|nr:hypothetical protein LY78DRAFT_494264 [Colletotrichum sublineola]
MTMYKPKDVSSLAPVCPEIANPVNLVLMSWHFGSFSSFQLHPLPPHRLIHYYFVPRCFRTRKSTFPPSCIHTYICSMKKTSGRYLTCLAYVPGGGGSSFIARRASIRRSRRPYTWPPLFFPLFPSLPGVLSRGSSRVYARSRLVRLSISFGGCGTKSLSGLGDPPPFQHLTSLSHSTTICSVAETRVSKD